MHERLSSCAVSKAKGAARDRRGKADTQTVLWLRLLPSGSGADGFCHPLRRGRIGRHAHGRGQIHLLSGPGPHAAGAHPGHLAPRFAHGRPGPRTQGGRRPAELSQFLAHARPAEHGAQARLRGLVSDHVRGARAPVRSSIRRIRPASGPARWVGPAPDRG